MSAIPLGDAPLFRRLTARTRLLRLSLALAILIIGIGAVLEARTPPPSNGPLLPNGSDGVVVLDMSASTTAAEFALIHHYLGQIQASRGRFGLVVFSDSAYEALAPNTPAAAFGTLSRFFEPPYPTNPWGIGFSLGTSISLGLESARNLILGDGLKRRNVWLISDLNDSSHDRPLLPTTLEDYIRSGIDLHVLPVDPAAADLTVYRRMFGTQSPTVRVRPLSLTPIRSKSYAFPLALAIIASLLAVALALNELLSTPLRWGSLRTEALT